MDWLTTFLHSSPLALLTLVIALGYALGEIRLPGNFRFGMAAILFVGLGFGFWKPELSTVIPEAMQTFGLAIFIYCIGLEAGPGFVRSLGKAGLKVNLLALLALVLSTGIVWLIVRSGFAGEKALLAGALCGIWNNTPALAAAVDSVKMSDPTHADQVVVGYGVAYPFSLTILLLFYHFLCRRAFGPSAVAPARHVHVDKADTLKVLNLPEGRDHWLPGEIRERTGLLLSRVFHTEQEAEVIVPTTRIGRDARVIAIGSREQLDAGAQLLGRYSGGTFESRHKGFNVHRYVISNPAISGHTVGEISDHLSGMNAVLTRVRRGDVELSVHRDIRLLPGDRVRVIAAKGGEGPIKSYLGDSLQALGSHGSISFVLGIFIGLLIGAIPIMLPGLSFPLKLGVAGGPLVAALILGHLGRTGPLVWSLPISNNLTLRNLGIAIFFASVGCRAGRGFGGVMNQQGLILVVTTILLVLFIHGLFILTLRLAGVRDIGSILGFSAGLHTQPAALTFAASREPDASVPISYATVFPVALVAKIILAQLLTLG